MKFLLFLAFILFTQKNFCAEGDKDQDLMGLKPYNYNGPFRK